MSTESDHALDTAKIIPFKPRECCYICGRRPATIGVGWGLDVLSGKYGYLAMRCCACAAGDPRDDGGPDAA